MADINLLLSRLEKVRQTNTDRFISCCPSHPDKSPSLQISQVADRILIHCFAGCGAIDVLESIGLDFSAIYPDGYMPNTNYIKVDAVDEIYIAVYKAKVRKGEIPTAGEKQRFQEIIGQMYP